MSSTILPGLEDFISGSDPGSHEHSNDVSSANNARSRSTERKQLVPKKRKPRVDAAHLKDEAGSSQATKIDHEIGNSSTQRRIANQLSKMPWVLRVTDRRDKPSPVLVIKYRRPIDQSDSKTELVDRGIIYGDSMRRCLPSIRAILSRVRDDDDFNLELHHYLTGKQITFRGNLPLNEAAGAKLSLLFRLQTRVKDLDRVELMALRITNFTGEEATYWLSRISHFGAATNRWAEAGMRVMLGGQPGDPAITELLKSIERE